MDTCGRVRRTAHATYGPQHRDCPRGEHVIGDAGDDEDRPHLAQQVSQPSGGERRGIQANRHEEREGGREGTGQHDAQSRIDRRQRDDQNRHRDIDDERDGIPGPPKMRRREALHRRNRRTDEEASQ